MPPVLQDGVKVQLEETERRCKSEEQCSAYRDRHEIGEDAVVHCVGQQVVVPLGGWWINSQLVSAYTPFGDEPSIRAAYTGEDQALYQGLPYDSPTPRP